MLRPTDLLDRYKFELRRLPDTHRYLAQSPLLRGAVATLTYAIAHGGIGLTATKAFRRDFVHWALRQFDWTGRPAGEVFRFQRFVN